MKGIFVPNRSERAVNSAIPNQMMRTKGVITSGFTNNVMVDWVQREIRHRSGRRCKLSVREAALLAWLARKAGAPVSRDEILFRVWQLDPRRTAIRTIDMHVSFLRRKLDDSAEEPTVLIPVYRVGYMLRRDMISCGDLPLATRQGGCRPLEVTAGIKSLSLV